MQVILSILELQQMQSKSPELDEIVKMSKVCIQSMMLVHEKLYNSVNFLQIDLRDYFEELIDHIIQSYVETTTLIQYNIEGKNVDIQVDILSPLSLIITELITNSIKCAFPNRDTGKISLKFTKLKTDKLEFIYKDNGIGYDEIETKNNPTLGNLLISSLSTQIRGTYQIDSSKGVEMKMIIPLKPIDQSD